MIITKTNKSFVSTSSLVFFLLILSCFVLTRCGFATVDPDPTSTMIIETETKYKVLITTPCSFRVEVKVQIPEEYEHYKKDLHQLAGIYGINGKLMYLRGAFGSWDTLSVGLPCNVCTTPVKGMISVLDDRIDLMPWGCGRQRPPVLVDYVHSVYISPKGATPIDKANEAEWQDENPVYEYTYMPEAAIQEEICDGQPVLFDLKPACQVLVDAGVLGY